MYSVFNLMPKKLSLFLKIVVGLVFSFFILSSNEYISGTLLFSWSHAMLSLSLIDIYKSD